MIDISIIESCNSCLYIENQDCLEIDVFNISTDTRSLSKANAFVCLYGENFDAHDFVPSLIESKFPLIIVEKNKMKGDEGNLNSCIVYVNNTYEFILELATKIMTKWKESGGVCIGITGSNGKTTNKEILTHLIKNVIGNSVLSTNGNLNNQIGVPLTIFRLKKTHTLAIIEMGTSLPGEIEKLSEVVQPDYGLITSIGPAHLEGLSSMEGVYKEKMALYRYIKNNISIRNNFVVNLDDEYLSRLDKDKEIITFGTSKGNYTLKLGIKTATLHDGEDVIKLNNENIISKHNWYNLIQCFLLTTRIYPSERQTLLAAAESFKIPKLNRGSWVEKNGRAFFMDAYNANPSSMKASLAGFLLEIGQEKIDRKNILVIMGDMNELGVDSEKYHTEIGEYIKRAKIENAFFVGKFAAQYQKGFEGGGSLFYDANSLRLVLGRSLDNYTHIFIKGSRSLQLESILDITF